MEDFTVGQILTAASLDNLMSQTRIRCTSATRPATPAAGWSIYETDTNRLYDYDGSGWVFQGFVPGRLFVRRTSDSTPVNNSTALISDTQLTLTPTINGIYALDGYIVYTSNITPDFKFAFTFPAGASLSWTGGGQVVTGGGGGGDFASNVAHNLAVDQPFGYAGGDAFVMALQIKGTLIMGSTAGALTARWAQNTANASDTLTKAGSWLRLIREL